MAFTVPQFNTLCAIRTGGSLVGAPRLEVLGNLAWGKRVNVSATGGTGIAGFLVMTMSLLLPAGTDVRGRQNASGPDSVEVPAGSGRFYLVTFVDDVGRGFANEHRCAELQQTGVWPTPIP
jgi:hypothetical protein